MDVNIFEKTRHPIYLQSPSEYPLSEYDGVGKRTEVWDAYTLNEGGESKSINILQNKGAWINSVINSSGGANHSSINPDLNNRPANCCIKKIMHSGKPRLYAVATRNIPRTYEIIQNYWNDQLIIESV
jgi:hypothetical protein